MPAHEKQMMPAAIQDLLNNLSDSRFTVWQRLPYRERLQSMRNIIDESIRKFDVEYNKAHKSGKKTEKIRA